MQKSRLKAELEVLFETGSELSRKFGEQQEARQEAWDAWEDSGEEGEPQETRGSLDFQLPYQRWYTCALPLVKEAAPDRYAEFQAYYEQSDRKPAERTYAIRDYFTYYSAVEYDCQPWLETLRCFLNQLYIIKAASDRMEWQSIADSLDHSGRDAQLGELEAARRLIPFNEVAAAVMAGDILQRFLQALARKHELRFRKLSPPARELAASLKQAKVLTEDAGNQCIWLAGIHERCFRDPGEQPTTAQARDLVDGTQWILTNVF